MPLLKYCLIGCLAAAAVGLSPAAAEPPAVGINLDANSDWMTAAAWVDVRHLFRRWGPVDRPWEEAPALALTADGYPLQDAAALTYLKGYPNGTYRLTYEGSGQVTFAGGGKLAGAVREGNRTEAEVVVGRRGPEPLIIAVTGVDPGNPLRALRLTAPGYPADGTQGFTREFLRRTGPFRVLRFTEWMRTSGSPVREWTDRARPGSFLSTGPSGVSYEDMVELANRLKKDIWINIPDQASDDYVRQLARFLRERLHPGAAIYLEYSSELWNFGLVQSHRNLQAARANPLLSRADDLGRASEQAAWKLRGFADLFHQEFGAGASRVRPVLAGQCADSRYLRAGLEFVRSKYGAPSRSFSGIAIAPYVSGSASRLSTPGLTLDRVFLELNRYLHNELSTQVREHRALSEEFSLPLLAYEGGQRLAVSGGVGDALSRKAQSDPRMGKLLQDLVTVWQRNGGGLFAHYSHVGPYTRSACWSLLENGADPGSVKWDALMELLLPAGDATLDGRVDFADFSLLRSEFKKGRWWEQGDFNRDGRVDETDLRLLKANLGAVTPAQAAEIARFEAPLRLEAVLPCLRSFTSRLPRRVYSDFAPAAPAGVFPPAALPDALMVSGKPLPRRTAQSPRRRVRRYPRFRGRYPRRWRSRHTPTHWGRPGPSTTPRNPPAAPGPAPADPRGSIPDT
jgi:hypothetical protein